MCDNTHAMSRPGSSDAPKVVGRYEVHERIASGGMASVHFGRLLGEVGFTRIVAIKRMHAHLSRDPEFAAMFLDEARLAARIHHPNVVATVDVVSAEDELFLVMEYVPGQSLQKLVREARAKGGALPPSHAVAIVVGALHGLHAAHEAKNATGEWLGIVHRDISPHNILVGEDGVARIIDFGVAKALERIHSTRDGGLRGKISYMAPEQLAADRIDRRADVYAASVVLWELLTGQRYLDIGNPAAAVRAVTERVPEPPSRIQPQLPEALDAVTLRGLAKKPEDRFETALAMATALERALFPSTQRELARWVADYVGDTLRQQRQIVRRIETAADPAGEVPDPHGSPSGDDASWLPSDALHTAVATVSQPSSLTLEAPHSTSRQTAPPRRASVIALSVLAGAVLGALLLLAIRSPIGRVVAAPPSASPKAEPIPPSPPSPSSGASTDTEASSSSETPARPLPAVLSSALPVASSPKPSPQTRHPAPAPPSSSAHRLPLFSRD